MSADRIKLTTECEKLQAENKELRALLAVRGGGAPSTRVPSPGPPAQLSANAAQVELPAAPDAVVEEALSSLAPETFQGVAVAKNK